MWLDTRVGAGDHLGLDAQDGAVLPPFSVAHGVRAEASRGLGWRAVECVGELVVGEGLDLAGEGVEVLGVVVVDVVGAEGLEVVEVVRRAGGEDC